MALRVKKISIRARIACSPKASDLTNNSGTLLINCSFSDSLKSILAVAIPTPSRVFFCFLEEQKLLYKTNSTVFFIALLCCPRTFLFRTRSKCSSSPALFFITTTGKFIILRIYSSAISPKEMGHPALVSAFSIASLRGAKYADSAVVWVRYGEKNAALCLESENTRRFLPFAGNLLRSRSAGSKGKLRTTVSARTAEGASSKVIKFLKTVSKLPLLPPHLGHFFK